MALLHNLMKNYTKDSADFIPKLTGQSVRLAGLLALSSNFSFNPFDIIYGVKS